jgi:hypothetical protein
VPSVDELPPEPEVPPEAAVPLSPTVEEEPPQAARTKANAVKHVRRQLG